MAVLALGAGIVVWMGSAFMVTNLLAVLVIAAIALCYLSGIVELARFQRDTQRLKQALHSLDEAAPELEGWLLHLPSSWRNPVRLRIRGEGHVLPTLVMTPHLTGLMVMLGLLGTFVGMVVTLQGAVAALENTAELEAIRTGLTAPIKGLGLAFGTSVAGVSASAALGFVATLWRRERQAVVRELDARTGNAFRSHSLPAYREKVLEVLQAQTAALPALVTRLTDHGQELERFLGRIDQTLTTGQACFHDQMLTIHRELADSVGHSLRQSLADSGRLAGDSIRPVVADAMAAISAANQSTQLAVRESAREQLQAVVQQLETTSSQLNGEWLSGLGRLVDGMQQLSTDVGQAAIRDQALSEQQQISLARIDQLVTALDERSDAQQRQLVEQAQALDNVAHDLATRLERYGKEHVERAAQTQQALSEQLSGHCRQLTEQLGEEFGGAVVSHSRQALAQVEPLWRETMATLVRETTATQGLLAQQSEQQTRALAAVTQELQAALSGQWATALAEQRSAQADFLNEGGQAIAALSEQFEAINARILDDLAAMQARTAESAAHETALRREQAALGEQLGTLVQTLQVSLADQQEALTRFVGNADALFAESSDRAEQQLAAGVSRLGEASDDFAMSVTELASLGEALAQWATAFEAANGQLKAAADQLESAVLASAERSDEQMGYYVAQAREVVDYSVQAQQALIEQMRQLARPV